MKEPTRYVNYSHLWKRLRRKYLQAHVPRIYLVRGSYPVAYEGGYDWIVGYCSTLEEAEKMVSALIKDLKHARSQLGMLFASERNHYFFYTSADSRWSGREIDPAIVKRFKDAWWESRKALDEKIYEIANKMIDHGIPYPNSHLIEKRDMDGPIQYHITEVLQCPEI